MSTIFGQTQSPFRSPTYQYIRSTDNLPSTDEAYRGRWAATKCRVKLFHPASSWTWYVAGFDPDTGLAYGVVDGHAVEVGDFDMNELAAIRLMTLPIERDLWWTPETINSLVNVHGDARS